MHGRNELSEAKLLGRTALFSGLPQETLQRLASKLRRRRLRPGHVIFYQDDPVGQLFIVAAGQVRIYVTAEDGRERDVALLGPGECFGEMSLLDDSRRSASAAAVGGTEVLVLERDEFQSFVRQHAIVAEHIALVLAQRLRQTDQMLADAFFLDVPRRVARELVQLARSIGERSPDGRVAIAIDQDELARLVGASREAVNRVLSAYQEAGVLATSRRRVEILDPPALERATSG